MPANEIELRAVIGNSSLPAHERKGAALCLVRLLIAAVPAPGDDHPAVIELMTPWPDRKLAGLWAVATEGRSLSGYSLHEAKAAALRKLKRARLEQLASDQKEHAVVRDAAALELNGPARRA